MSERDYDPSDDRYDEPRRRRKKPAKASIPVWAIVAIVLGSMIVCIGPVVLAIGILLPVVSKVREAAGQQASQNNLKQIGLGALGFTDVNLRLPGNGSGVGVGLPSFQKPNEGSFHYQILPYIEQDALYRNPPAQGSAPNVVKTYLDPARARMGAIEGQPVCDYAVNVTALYGMGETPNASNTTKTLTFADVKDGTSSTIQAGQKAMNPTDYATTNASADASFLRLTSGGTSQVTARYTIGVKTSAKAGRGAMSADYLTPTVSSDATAPLNMNDQFGGPYPNGVLFLFCDGHVQMLSHQWLGSTNTITANGVTVSQFRAALTPNGGEVYNLE